MRATAQGDTVSGYWQSRGESSVVRWRGGGFDQHGVFNSAPSGELERATRFGGFRDLDSYALDWIRFLWVIRLTRKYDRGATSNQAASSSAKEAAWTQVLRRAEQGANEGTGLSRLKGRAA